MKRLFVVVFSVLLLGTAFAGSGVAAAGDTPAAAASTADSTTWGTVELIPGVASLNTGDNASLSGVSCSSPGNCGGEGSYTDASQVQHGFLVSETNGKWGTAQAVSGLAADTGPVLLSISCTKTGDCSAIGQYTNSGGYLAPFVVTETNGKWGNAQTVKGLAAISTGLATLNGLSCTAPGDCTAVGAGYDNNPKFFTSFQGFAVTETNGTWGTVQTFPSMVALNTLGNGELSDVSCTAPGDCLAGGSVDDGFTSPVIITETNGTWGAAETLPGAKDEGAGAAPISCTRTGDCTAIVGIHVDTETSGSWGKLVASPVPADFSSDLNLDHLSCSAPGNCGAGGFYINTSGNKEPFVVSEASGAWGKAEVVPGAGAPPDSQAVNSISCATTGYCHVTGGSPGFVADETNGTWGRALAPKSPASVSGLDAIITVSCTTASDCSAGGRTGSGQAFAVSSSGPGCQAASAQCNPPCPTSSPAVVPAGPAGMPQTGPVVTKWGDYWYAAVSEGHATESAQGRFYVAQPKVSDCHSLAEMAVYTKPDEQVVEVGWIVDPVQFRGDDPTLPHLFVYHWVNGVPGGYPSLQNEHGFQPESTKIYPGVALKKNSWLVMRITHTTAGWQIYVGSTWVGFFPASRWKKGTFDKALGVEWFGEVSAALGVTKPCTRMGNGNFPGNGADEITNQEITNSEGKAVPAVTSPNSPTDSNYYRVEQITLPGSAEFNNMAFGGPGAACT
jgi:hypothetical protein